MEKADNYEFSYQYDTVADEIMVSINDHDDVMEKKLNLLDHLDDIREDDLPF